MATTTNYNWSTPDDTDLVKDGAAAIRTLGSSIDTTTKALNPSTTLGDIEYRSSTANTNTRLGIGSNGQVLTVSAGVPAWGSASPTFVGCVLKNNGTQSIANSTYTNVTFNLENIDTNGFHSTVTNTDRITIPAGLAGKYRFTAQVRFDSNSSGYRRMDIEPTGGGSSITNGIVAPVNGSGTTFTTTGIFDCAEGDYFTLAVLQTSGGSLNLTSGDSGTALASTVFSAEYLGA